MMQHIQAKTAAVDSMAKPETQEIVKFQETVAPPGTCVLNRGGFQIVQRCTWLMLIPDTSNPHQGKNAPTKAIAAAKMETGLILHRMMIKLSITSNNPER